MNIRKYNIISLSNLSDIDDLVRIIIGWIRVKTYS